MTRRTTVASVAACALILAGCTSSPSPTTSTSDPTAPAPVQSSADPGSVAAAATPLGDVQPWKAGAVPGSDATGPEFPKVWPASVVAGSGSATSLSPVLRPDGVTGNVDVEVVDLSAGGGFGPDGFGEATGVVWQGSADARDIALPQGNTVLEQGHSYAYRVREGKSWKGPWTFAVDRIRQGVAPLDSLGGVQVNLLSGVPSTTWSARPIVGPAGALTIGLAFRPGTAATAGLPAGWTWLLPGTGLVALQESGGQEGRPASVRLMTATGGGPTFVRTESGAYVPGLADGTAASYAAAGTLVNVGEGLWSLTAPDGTVSEFKDGHLDAQWLAGEPIAAFDWDAQGRLTSVSDGITGGQAVTLAYGSGCGEAAGFVKSDLLCSLTYPDSSVTQFGYVNANGTDELGMVVDPGGVGRGWGWDASGRLASVRGVSATAMAAVDAGWSDAQFTTQIAYDKDGRVESVTNPAVKPGAPRVQRSYQYPDASGEKLVARVMQSLLDADSDSAVQSSLGGGAVVQVSANIGTWNVDERRGIDGLSTDVTYDPETGVVTQGRTTNGRTVVMKTDDEGLMTSSVGPFLGDSVGAMRTSRTMDATVLTPEDASADSAVRPWSGLAAIVWAQGKAGSNAWWDGKVLSDGLAATFRGAPVQGGLAEPWRAQATGMWKVAESGTYDIAIDASDATKVDLTIDGMRCSTEGQESGCSMPLRKGQHSLLLTIDASDSQGKASFAVRAGTGGRPRALDVNELSPHFNVATRLSTNDVVDGRDLGTDVLVTSRPWTGQPDQVVAAGGLTTSYTYESTDAQSGGFGRVTTSSTPGGSTMSATYYGVGEMATNPCTKESLAQNGLLKSITRYDGVVVTTVYDTVGRPVAVTTAGDGDGQLVCTTYDAAGRVVGSSTSNAKGALIEKAEKTTTIGDGRLTTTTTTTLGPAAPEGSGESFTASLVTDLAGRTVEIADASGTKATFDYAADGTLLKRDLWAPKADPQGDPTLALEFAYDPVTARPVSITANGKTLAQSTYDARGQLDTVTYPNDVSMSLVYGTSGDVTALKVLADGRSYASSRERNAAGRSLSSEVVVTEEKKEIAHQHWTYSYDNAGRLVTANLTSAGDKVVTGGAKRSFAYEFGQVPEGCFAGAGDNLDRTGGALDGTSYSTCRDGKGRLQWTSDPHITGGSGKASATYDGMGRMTKLDGAVPVTLTWGSGTQVASLSEGDVTTSFVMTGGVVQRMTRVESDQTTVTAYGYAGSPTPVFVLDDAGEVLDTRLSLPGGAVAHLGAQPLTSPMSLSLPDAFGAAFVTTLDGVPVGSTPSGLAPRFGPYGEPLQQEAPPTSAETGIGPGTTYGFQAGARNATVVGHHAITLMARPYDPWLGEFLASDPTPGASSTDYGYGDADPLDQPDTSGGWTVWDTVGVIGAGLSVIAGVSAGSVSAGTSRAVKVATGAAMVAGSAAAIGGTVMSWVEGNDRETSAWVTAAAVAGLAVAGVGLNRWSNVADEQVVNVRNSQIESAGEQSSFLSEESIVISGPDEGVIKHLGSLGTGVDGVEVQIMSIEGRTHIRYVGPNVLHGGMERPLGMGLNDDDIELFVMNGKLVGYVSEAEGADQTLMALLGTFWDGF